MTASDVTSVIVTTGIVGLAGLFAWQHDAAYAMACVMALLPSASGVSSQIASKIATPPSPQLTAAVELAEKVIKP